MTDQNNLHDHILTEVRDDASHYYASYLKNKQILTDEGKVSDFTLLKFMFKNYRKSGAGHKGLRLTYNGHLILSKHYESYVYLLEDVGATRNKTLVSLDRKMQWPYYIGKNSIVFFSKHDSGWFKLNGYNLESLLEYL